MTIKIDEKAMQVYPYGCITITLPLQEPKLSKSGKTKVIASQTGETDKTYKGKPVHVSVNVYIPKD
tara:strand:- start:5663 stop:5860 length:198 start_codon:yes stop_codon:yes gene_type:complete